MFYDLNVPWSANDTQHLPRTLAFLHELGYNVVALNHNISGKLPADLACPIPNPLPFSKEIPEKLTVLRRCTLTLTQSYQNARLAALAQNYDILALRPIDEKTLSLACSSLDCDIISLDLTQRLPYWFKHKMLNEAVKSGKRFEICYAQGIAGDSGTRRNLISNATQLIRASRGRGLVISSEASSGPRGAVACRGPWDVINLAAVWGLAQEKGYEAVSKECRSVVVSAKLKRTSWRGVVDVVYGGEKPVAPAASEMEDESGKGKGKSGVKRKVDAMEAGEKNTGNASVDGHDVEKPISKRQMKRQKREQARLQAVEAVEQDTPAGAENGTAQEVQIPGDANNPDAPS